jgi:hypothetical protein
VLTQPTFPLFCYPSMLPQHIAVSNSSSVRRDGLHLRREQQWVRGQPGRTRSLRSGWAGGGRQEGASPTPPCIHRPYSAHSHPSGRASTENSTGPSVDRYLQLEGAQDASTAPPSLHTHRRLLPDAVGCLARPPLGSPVALQPACQLPAVAAAWLWYVSIVIGGGGPIRSTRPQPRPSHQSTAGGTRIRACCAAAVRNVQHTRAGRGAEVQDGMSGMSDIRS